MLGLFPYELVLPNPQTPADSLWHARTADMDWKLRLQLSRGGTRDVTLPAGASRSALLAAITAAIGMDSALCDVKVSEKPFPPSWVPLGGGTESLLSGLGIRNNSTLQVILPEESCLSKAGAGSKVSQAKSKAISKTKAPSRATAADASDSDSSGDGGKQSVADASIAPARPVRAAAVRARDTMSAMIEAQEAAAKQAAETKTAKPATKTVTSPRLAAGHGAIAGIHASTSISGSKRPQSPAARSGGSRIHQLSTASGSKNPHKRFKYDASLSDIGAASDPMEAMTMRLASASGGPVGAHSDPLVQFLRAASKSALLKQYDISRAVS